MAYDSAFISFTGQASAVEPLTVSDFNPADINLQLTTEYRPIIDQEAILASSMESWDHSLGLAQDLRLGCKQGAKIDGALYRILKKELKIIAQESGQPYDELPAMEDLNSNTKRDLVFAMENMVVDAIKGIWEKIRNAFLAIHKRIKDWYLKAWDGSVRLQNQAEQLKAKAEALNTAPREANFEMGGVKALNIGGKTPAAADIIKGISLIETISTNFMNKTSDGYTKIFPNLEGALKSLIDQAKQMKDSDASTNPASGNAQTPPSMGDAFGGIHQSNSKAGETATNAAGVQFTSTGEVNKLIEALGKIWQEVVKDVGLTQVVQNDDRWNDPGYNAFRNPQELLGGNMVVGVAPADKQGKLLTNADYSFLKRAYKVTVTSVTAQPKDLEDNGTWATANGAEIISICESTINSCKIFLNYKLLYEARDRATGNIVKQMEQYVSANSQLKGAGSTHVKNSIQTTMSFLKNMNGSEASWAKYSMQTLNKAIGYCKASLSQY